VNTIGPELPLIRDKTHGLYGMITSYTEEVQQNFKNLLLTAPGERIMNPDFGVGLRHFLFEPRVNVKPRIKQRIQAQVRKYMPFINIDRISFDSGLGDSVALEESPILSVAIEYSVPGLDLSSGVIIENEDII
jgi:phage baseplate assembly protein W